jgi:hypothetical protein
MPVDRCIPPFTKFKKPNQKKKKKRQALRLHDDAEQIVLTGQTDTRLAI